MKKRKIANIIIQSVFLAIVITFSTLFILDRVFVERSTMLPHSSFCISNWEWVHEDGTREKITLPTVLDTEVGETVVLETTVPYVIREGYWLMLFNLRDLKLYVGDELRYEFEQDKPNIQGGIVKGVWSFTKLNEDDYGKTIRIVRDSKKTVNGIFKELYYGDGLGVCYEYVKAHAAFYFFSILMIVLADFLIISGTLMHWISGHKVALVKLGIGMMCASLWLIFDSELYQLIFDDYYADGLMAYMVITLVPVPLLQYINQMQKYRHEHVHNIMCAYALAETIILAVLHFTGVCSYLKSMNVIIVSYGLLTVGALYTIVKDHIGGYMNQYKYVEYGMYGFIASAIIEMILMIVKEDRNDGAMLLFGFYIILLSGLVQQVIETTEADRARRQAMEANRQKSTFLANMSHEIRTPINSIIGMNEMILRENKDPRVREYAQQVASSGRLLLGLINDVLDFSKIEAGKMDIINAPFDTVEAINDIEVLMRERASTKKLIPVFEISESIPTEISGDEVHFKQILLNLISNAVKYTNEGTVTLSIDTSDRVVDDRIDMRVSIKDTGIGIRQENLDKLFDTFTRVDLQRNSSIEGTGLGLSIVKSLVEAMGGTITVESQYGIGSKFTVVIPFEVTDRKPIGDINKAVRNLDEADIYVEKFHAPKAQLLAVDDNLVNLKVVCELLKTTKINIDTASGGRECVMMCRDKRYDLILMDHRMPDPDGIETLHILKNDFDGLNAETPVIVLTANAFAGLKEKYLAEGFADYLSKPIDSKLLESKIMKFLPAELVEICDEETAVKDSDVNIPSGIASEPVEVPAGRTPAERLRNIKEMDYDTTVTTYGGSDEFMITLLTTIVSEGYNKINRMKEALASKDYKNYRVDAHAAKSDMATIGATAMSERAKSHEFAVRDGDFAFIEKDADDFIREYKKLLDRIDAAMK